MRYHSGSLGDVSNVSIRVLNQRMKNFRKVHNTAVQFRAKIAGAKVKGS